jgi:hypothetical protein
MKNDSGIMTYAEPVSSGLIASFTIGLFNFIPKDLAVFHDELDVLQDFNIAKRIASERNNISVGPCCNHANLTLHVEHVSGA